MFSSLLPSALCAFRLRPCKSLIDLLVEVEPSIPLLLSPDDGFQDEGSVSQPTSGFTEAEETSSMKLLILCLSVVVLETAYSN